MSTQSRPNLFLVGAMKSGTSSLHAHLGKHPEVFMSEVKEPGYFLDEFTRGRGEDWYLGLFSGAGGEKIIGESSTHYTKLPRFSGAARRIHDFNPAARIIYIMRDPVQRTISHYWHAVYSHNERRPMLRAIMDDPHYRNVSHYAMQLEPYLELFGREQVCILTFEELIHSPDETMKMLFSWLGVDPSYRLPDISKGHNIGEKKFVRPGRMTFLNRLRFTKFWDVASRVVPQPVKTLARKVAEREYDRSSQPVEPVVDYLRPLQIEETRELCRLLGREFPEWKLLYGTGERH